VGGGEHLSQRAGGLLLVVVLLVELFTAPVVAALGAYNFTDASSPSRPSP
jgi:hypothetical protein